MKEMWSKANWVHQPRWANSQLTCTSQRITVNQTLKTFSVKGQTVNILGFSGHLGFSILLLEWQISHRQVNGLIWLCSNKTLFMNSSICNSYNFHVRKDYLSVSVSKPLKNVKSTLRLWAIQKHVVCCPCFKPANFEVVCYRAFL